MQNCRFPKGKAEVWASWSLLKVCLPRLHPHLSKSSHLPWVCLAGHWERPFPVAGSWIFFPRAHEHPLSASGSTLQLEQHGFGALWEFQQHIPAHLPALPLPGRLWGSHTELIVNEAEESLGFSGHSSPELLLLSWHTQTQHCREALSPPPTAPFSPKLRPVVNCNPLLKKSSLRACAGRKEKAPRGAGAQLHRLPCPQAGSPSPPSALILTLFALFLSNTPCLFSTCNSSTFRFFTKANIQRLTKKTEL